MKKQKESDVDFIGGQGSLTATEVKALSDFFRKRKLTSKKPIHSKKLRTTKPQKETA